MEALSERKQEMIERHLEARGIRGEDVLTAMRDVPREEFVGQRLVEFAYDDTPLPIEEEQTISQPYIVALMAELLAIRPGDKVLDIGTGSGYAAAVLSKLASKVYSVERHRVLAETARERFRRLGYDNIEVLHADGTRGWPEHAPFDVINVAAGGHEVPEALKEQLAEGGRLLIPVGADPRVQRLLRLVRRNGGIESRDLGHVRFVPLIQDPVAGSESGDERPHPKGGSLVEETSSDEQSVSGRIREAAEPFTDIDTADLDALMERIGDCRVVLLGESTHGTSEFYTMRARVSRELIEKKGFDIIAVEADWPDAAHIDRLIRETGVASPPRAFDRFPTWMWRNEEISALAGWLKRHNDSRGREDEKVGFFGLDLYSLFSSIDAVINYLREVDPELAELAIHRYGCLSPYERDPGTYGAAAISDRYAVCEDDVVHVLTRLLERQAALAEENGYRLRDAIQNARLAANAEKYYRVMYTSARASWNQRDSHMFETLQSLLAQEGAKAIVWAHNSHIGNAAATEMGVRGEHNLGQLAKKEYAKKAYAIGFATGHGTVAAADEWGGAMQIKEVRPAVEGSFEHLMHETGMERFILPLHQPGHEPLNAELSDIRLERAIGVVYRPHTELQSHYFQASLTNQFDELIWFDQSTAVTPLEGEGGGDGVPDTFPFGI